MRKRSPKSLPLSCPSLSLLCHFFLTPTIFYLLSSITTSPCYIIPNHPSTSLLTCLPRDTPGGTTTRTSRSSMPCVHARPSRVAPFTVSSPPHMPALPLTVLQDKTGISEVHNVILCLILSKKLQYTRPALVSTEGPSSNHHTVRRLDYDHHILGVMT